MVEMATIFMTGLEIDAMLRRENNKASVSLVCLDLKPPYLVGRAYKVLSPKVCNASVLEV